MDICRELVRIAKDIEAWIDDPNPKSKKCPKCGRNIDYDPHTMSYRCTHCHYFERGRSRLASERVEGIGRVAGDGEELPVPETKILTVYKEAVSWGEEGDSDDYEEKTEQERTEEFDDAEEVAQFLQDKGVAYGMKKQGADWWESEPEQDWNTGDYIHYSFFPQSGFTEEELEYIDGRIDGKIKKSDPRFSLWDRD